MPRRSPLALLPALAVLAILSPAASAVTLTHHVTLPHGVTHRAQAHRVVSWHVGMDSDHDGIWNGPDACAHQAGPQSAGGCKPEPVAAVVSESVAPTPASTSEAPLTAGSGAPVDISCESGGDYSINTGNGYYGAYQFDSATWDRYGDSAYAEANEAPPAVQDAAAASVPYDAWPNC